VEPNLNLGLYEHSKSPDMTEPSTPSGHQRHLQEKAVDEFSRLVILLGYLWVVFELLSVHKSLVLSVYHLNYPEHAFAIINSLVFAEVLFTRNCVWDIVFKLLRYVRAEPRPARVEEDVMGSWLIFCLVLSVLLGSVFAPEIRAETDLQDSSRNSPVGQWKTVDDVTGKAKSVVVIWEENGKLYGRIQKLLDPDPSDPIPGAMTARVTRRENG
jgi:hypothetical protein